MGLRLGLINGSNTGHKVTEASVSIDTSKQLRVSNTVSWTGHFTQTLGTTLVFC